MRLQEEGVPGGFGRRHPAATPSKAAVLGSTADERCAQLSCTGCLRCTQSAQQYAACPQCYLLSCPTCQWGPKMAHAASPAHLLCFQQHHQAGTMPAHLLIVDAAGMFSAATASAQLHM